MAANPADPQSSVPPAPAAPRPVRVFISYAQSDAAHLRAVRDLALALQRHNLAVELDQFHDDELIHWPRWCAEQVRDSDFVLMICTPVYRERIENQVNRDEGRGVFWEGQLIYNALYREKDNRRFVPVLLDQEPTASIPDVLQGWNSVRLCPGGAGPDPDYSKLLRLLTKGSNALPAATAAPEPSPPTNPRRAARLPDAAAEEIAAALQSSPTLCAALAAGFAAGADPAVLAARLCDPNADFLAALDALDTALSTMQQRASPSQDLTTRLQRDALTILGWTTVATVAEGYDGPDADLVQPWRDDTGVAFRLPLGRGPCVEVLTARWRDGKAEFQVTAEAFDDGPDNLAPLVMQEPGFDDPANITPDRALDTVINRVWQEMLRRQANTRPTPARRADTQAWLAGQARKYRRRLRLVLDLGHPLADPTVLRAINAYSPNLLLILVNDAAEEAPDIFVLPPADLSAAIRDCLAAIRNLA